MVLAVMWGLGVLVRSRRAREVERRRLSAQAAIAAERGRPARELHDVVTHHVTATVVQAGAAQYLAGSPDRVNEALDAWSRKESGRPWSWALSSRLIASCRSPLRTP
jgi:signal transduction histidine kinase